MNWTPECLSARTIQFCRTAAMLRKAVTVKTAIVLVDVFSYRMLSIDTGSMSA
jgi:hypothetical protein